jgi:hypothetical protein
MRLLALFAAAPMLRKQVAELPGFSSSESLRRPLVSMNETAVMRLDLLSNIGTGLEYCFRTATRDLEPLLGS